MTAVSSIRLLVVAGSPPKSSRSCPPHSSSAPQPPGPGLPLHAPSVWMTQSLIKDRPRCVRWTRAPAAAMGQARDWGAATRV